MAGADAPGPGRAEAHHHGPPGRLGSQGRRRRWPGRRRCPFRPGRVPAGPLPLLRLSSAPRKLRSGAERTAARGHGERTQTRSGQRAARRRPRSRPGARGGGPVRRLSEGGPSSPTHRASARDRRRVHRRPSRHLQGRPGPGGPGHSWPRRRTMPATHADRRPRAMPRSVAPGLSRPRSEQAPYRRFCSKKIGEPASDQGLQIIRSGALGKLPRWVDVVLRHERVRSVEPSIFCTEDVRCAGLPNAAAAGPSGQGSRPRPPSHHGRIAAAHGNWLRAYDSLYRPSCGARLCCRRTTVLFSIRRSGAETAPTMRAGDSKKLPTKNTSCLYAGGES